MEFKDYFKTEKEHVIFDDRGGFHFAFIKFAKPRSIRCWTEPRGNVSEMSSEIVKLDITQVHSDDLKALNIWSDLPESIKEEVSKVDELRQHERDMEERAMHGKMENARKSRKRSPLYEKMPDKLECSECGKQAAYCKGHWCQRADKEDKSVFDLLKEYKCGSCGGSKKGKKANPEWAHIPKEMVCECGYVAVTPKRVMVEKAKKSGVDVVELVKSYQCRKCKKAKKAAKSS